jgi:hypothetical protein
MTPVSESLSVQVRSGKSSSFDYWNGPQLHGFAMRSVAIGIRPSFFALGKSFGACQFFGGN